MSNLNKKKILFVMTGSIAAYKACAVLSKLAQNNFEIKVVMTPGSLNFIGKSTIEGLTGQPPITDMYSDGQAMDHIHLDRWADLIVVAPATAHYINRIANGIGDDLLTTLFLAHDFKKPYLVTPAMNTMMYLHPTTQRSLKKLKEIGVEILETASGVLACGEVGFGRLLEPELIYQEIVSRLHPNKSESAQRKPALEPDLTTSGKEIKVLITAGGTSEPIDDVRVITNKSTGKTGASLADHLAECGLKITFLHSENSTLPKNSIERRSFTTFSDLKIKLESELKSDHFDWVIHTAAVSDYSVVSTPGKISSDQDTLTLTLHRNPKLVNQIKLLSPNTKLISFKLTSTDNPKIREEKVQKLLQSSQSDYVVQNEAQQIHLPNRPFNIYHLGAKTKKIQPMEKVEGIESLASALFGFILENKELS